jgi:hypothetical protein
LAASGGDAAKADENGTDLRIDDAAKAKQDF